MLKLKDSGFSLVEITLAIGIVSFAFVSMLGLIPTGLKTFRDAVDTSICGQISQRLINEAQQTDFDNLIALAAPARPAIRYFDDQGNELPAANANAAVYHVNTRIVASTTLPGDSTSANANLALVTVQVATDPGNIDLDSKIMEPGSVTDPTAPTRGLWKTHAGFAVSTYSTMVARNQ